ncbi:Biotin-(acetyl-CoA carboxylase) ligase [Loktanella sp. DSM 29012]|uniref:biotin/lipoate--protein ligase family protein n=1 Tax=Loktanella sp. DSM 29012 TaxID=1881056 RepID=UPI0008CE64AD|nr:biotin/lipoate--protein ligase family protein [Loktanella sp. DSM 29012]SEP92591.1 Biotin-(acetyl-CoA carboxylase) ligase [Loktanella sp. DSM 29012]
MPDFPPLFRGQDCAGTCPVTAAIAAGQAGADPGLVCYDLAGDRLRAAILFAPEVPLAQAAIMLPLCAVGFQNALGTLAPPVVAIHLGWDGNIYVNGGRCGELTLHAPDCAGDAAPDWLVIGLTLDLWPRDTEGGASPDQTTLYAEGCAEVAAPDLLSAWVRHSLSWLDTWTHDGPAPLHRDYVGLVHGMGKDVTLAGRSAHLLGLDESFGALLRSGDDTTLVPLTTLIKETA